MRGRRIGVPLMFLMLLATEACGTPGERQRGSGYSPREEATTVNRDLAEAEVEESTQTDVASVAPAAAPAAAGRPHGTLRVALADMQQPHAKQPISAAAAEVAKPGAEPAAARGPLLIYTAQLTMAVFEVAAGLRATEALAKELGGYLAQQANTSITIRVPAQRFDEAMRRLEKVGDVINRNVRADDVTQEFQDTEVRLKNARAVRERLEHLLARANKVEESIAIERELERVARDIDQMEGRLKFLRDRIAYSTITVTFSARRDETVAQGTFRLPFPWLNQLGLGRLLDMGLTSERR